jgi:hypothetical protein
MSKGRVICPMEPLQNRALLTWGVGITGDRFRRKAAVAARSGEGLVTMLCGPPSMDVRLTTQRCGRTSHRQSLLRWKIRAPPSRRQALTVAARGPGGAVGRGAMRGARPADADAVRMTRLFALGAVILAIAGCTPATPIAWDRPNVTEAELSMDKAKCELAAETANPDRAGTLLGLRQGRVQHSQDLCMQSRGYTARAAQ